MAEKTGYTYYADPQQVDFTLRMTVPALANEVLNTAGVDAQRKGFGIDKLNKENQKNLNLSLLFLHDLKRSKYDHNKFELILIQNADCRY